MWGEIAHIFLIAILSGKQSVLDLGQLKDRGKTKTRNRGETGMKKREAD